ncbi:L-lactate permease [Rugosimonospora acidiphila]|uniref:L-lactate permease n=1 Tax=Rugosimonospora acidiphila TaxID=556531 RepID=A0ABP9RVA2_9ACTN
MYQQVLDPVSHSLGLSAIFAALPLVVLFVLLGVLRVTAWISALIALVVALVVATVVYPMPIGQAALAATLGAAFGFFPILWIVINAIWIYNMTVDTGHFDVLRRSFSRVSDDQRIQAIIIAFCFGALMEALGGFGTPVAITSVMLIALGFKPLRAATLALVANTAPVAFGALAVPITTLSTVTGLPVHDLGAMVGRQTPILAVVVPLVLVGIVDGRRGLRQTWVPAVVCGVAFGVAQYATSNFISVPLTDIVASLFSAAAVVVLLRVWQPAASSMVMPTVTPVAGGSVDTPDSGFQSRVAHPDSRREELRAYAPYLIIIVIFVVAQIHPILHALDTVTRSFTWPGMHILSTSGKPSTVAVFKFNWLTAAGSLMFISGLVTAPVLGISVGRALRAYGRTLRQLVWAIITVMAVLALAYVMNASGQTATLGNSMAGAGAAFAVLSPILGWLGVAVTGSDTSSNSLFGALQVAAGTKAGLSTTLMAAANSSGGVLGKMISPQNLAIAAGAVGLTGKEGDIFRRVFGWSLAFLAGMCLLVYLQSTPVLSWMIP